MVQVRASFLQEFFFLADQQRSEPRHFIVNGAYRLRGVLDPDAFERSLREVARRHDALRMSLHRVGDEVYARVALDPEPSLARSEQPGATPEERVGRARDQLVVAARGRDRRPAAG